MASVALSCLMTTCNVNPEVNTADVELADNGEPKSEFDRKLQTELANLATKYGTEKLNTLVKEVNKLKEAGSLEKYLVREAIERSLKALGVSAAGQLASKAAGPVGWIIFAANVINFSVKAGPILVAMNYAVNSAQAVQTFAMLRTSADEMKNHDADINKTGSVTALLENGVRDDGSGSSAESVPMFQDISAGSMQTASLFESIMPTAFAATSVDDPRIYECDNGDHVETCMSAKHESALTKSSFFLGEIPGMQFIASIAGLVSDVVDGILSPIIDIITRVPPFSNITELISKTFAPLVGLLVTFVLVDQMKNPDGGRIGDGAMFGANISGNHSAHRLIGGKKISAAQRAEIMESFYAAKQAEFANKPLAYRLFSNTDNMSLVAQAASTYPSMSSGGVQSNVASLLSAPFAGFGATLGSLFTTQRTFAAITLDAPQDVDQYGIPLNDPELKNDPEVVYEKYRCGDPEQSLTAAYNKASVGEADPVYGSTGYIDQGTQQPTNTSVNYCALLKTSVASAGALYTNKVLSSDDLNSGSQATATSGGGNTKITGNIDFSDSSGGCPTGTKSLGTVKTRYSGSQVSSPYPTILLCQLSSIAGTGDGPDGNTVSGGAVVNKQVAAAFQALGEAAKAAGNPITASSFRLEDSCGGTTSNSNCASPGQSAHQLGIAIDIGSLYHSIPPGSATPSCENRDTRNTDLYRWLRANAASQFGIRQFSRESWHWDASNLSLRCS